MMATHTEVMIKVLMKQLHNTVEQICALSEVLETEDNAQELFAPIGDELNRGRASLDRTNKNCLLYDALNWLYQMGGDESLSYAGNLRCLVAAKIVLTVLDEKI